MRYLSFTLLFLLLLFLSLPANAQNSIEDLEPEQYFDFWVGEWELSWTDKQGNQGKGINVIEKILDGEVIQEHFESTGGSQKGYKGTSISVYNPQRESWHQAWADNQGGYIDLLGSVDGNKRIFQTGPRPGPQGNTIISRMVFYDITENTFTWDWESSTNEGDTWMLNWRIEYKRVK
ncbi:DUF1579 family protein [Balneolaceae bacterium YR4-1]|uniref:DUF1579 family protein n=1 Tax=Halalkalibaculum roseum TaxID=2709311 RepID=A0A6M1T4W9_9BACT|nr:DUF1579 family protein [Halalkalibaculum roseum]NGP77035.1 DUF1579 family protein [Halalkalibaculum roseum]